MYLYSPIDGALGMVGGIPWSLYSSNHTTVLDDFPSLRPITHALPVLIESIDQRPKLHTGLIPPTNPLSVSLYRRQDNQTAETMDIRSHLLHPPVQGDSYSR